MHLISIATAVLYLLTAVWLAMRLFKFQQQQQPLLAPVQLVLLLSLLLHAYLLLQTIPVAGGYRLGFYQAFSLMSWVVAAMLFIISLFRPVSGLGMVFLPVAALAAPAQVFMPSSTMVVAADSLGLRLHILLSITAYGMLTIAVVQALILRYQQANLHDKKPGSVLNILPPMQNMEKFLIQILTVGFFILSLSLVTGLMFVHNIFTQHLAHKVVFSVIAWLTFGIVLWGRWSQGWRGKKLLHWILGGFVCLVLAYFGTKAVFDLILDRF
ncbi:MAG: cytochrome C assembly family protein [Gammaproteobacteria bacterium]